MIKQVESSVFKEKLKSNNYVYCFGYEQGYNIDLKYEVQLNKNIVGIMSNGQSKPQVKEWNSKYVISINNETHILDKNSQILLKSFMLKASVYEPIIDTNLLYIFGEIDIIILDENLEVLEKIELSDILVDYKVQDGVLSYKTDNSNWTYKNLF